MATHSRVASMLSNPALLRVSSLLGLSHGCLSPRTIPYEQTVPLDFLIVLHNCTRGKGNAGDLEHFFPRKTLIQAHQLGINSSQDTTVGAKQRSELTENHCNEWFLLKQTKHSNFQKLFEIKSTIIWARVGSKKVFQTSNNGFSMILQGVHRPISTIMHSNKDYSSKPKMHCSFVICTFCPWSHGKVLRLQTNSKHWLWCDISTWLPPPSGSC